MSQCPICQNAMNEGRCPFCPEDLVHKFNATAPDAFPRTALPPPGVCNGGVVRALAMSLFQNSLDEADAQWATIAAGLRPLGPEGRRQTADCMESWARLKLRRGMTAEAERLFQRAASARKDPQASRARVAPPTEGEAAAPAPQFHQDPKSEPKGNWDSDAWKRLQPEADKSDRSEALERTRKELDAQLAADAQRIRAFKIAGLALLGALGTSITGTPIYIGALVGAVAGFVWSRFG
jgi:hypothetical protein